MTMADSSKDSNGFWLFGYGSLIWKPPPHVDRRLPGYVEGYVRRFWQASEDHRGTPEAPGRVLTLIERSYWEELKDRHTVPEDRVWGVAYRISASKVAEVKEYLDIREINGYSMQYTAFNSATPADTETSLSPPPPSPITCLVYIGLPTNPQFVGVQEPQALAEHIYKSKGPSGENREYLYMLDRALQDLSAESGDEHVRDLAARVSRIEENDNKKKMGGAEEAVEKEMQRVRSGEEGEELEEAEKVSSQR